VVKNLVFDSSCEFNSAGIAGAVSVWAHENVAVINVTNNAFIVGFKFVGGLIGEVMEAKSVVIQDCQNNGTIYMGVLTLDFIGGGFIGKVTSEGGMNLVIENSSNHGVVNGTQRIKVDISGAMSSVGPLSAGGFIGYVVDRNNDYVTITNCANDGNASVTLKPGTGYAGGFIGRFTGVELGNNMFNDSSVILHISNSSNSGYISVSSTVGAHSGGFIGHMSHTYLSISVDESENYGIVSCLVDASANFVTVYFEVSSGGLFGHVQGDSSIELRMDHVNNSGYVSSFEALHGYADYYLLYHAGGFVGKIEANDGFMISIGCSHCISNGTIESEQIANGFFSTKERAIISIENSASKGSYSGSLYQNALSDQDPMANSVVVLCNLSGEPQKGFYLKQGYPFEKMHHDGMFYRADSNNARVEGLLNKESYKNNWKYWSSELEYTDHFSVTFVKNDPGNVLRSSKEDPVNVSCASILGDLTIEPVKTLAIFKSIPNSTVPDEVLWNCFNLSNCSIVDVFDEDVYDENTIILMDLTVRENYTEDEDMSFADFVVDLDIVNSTADEIARDFSDSTGISLANIRVVSNIDTNEITLRVQFRQREEAEAIVSTVKPCISDEDK